MPVERLAVLPGAELTNAPFAMSADNNSIRRLKKACAESQHAVGQKTSLLFLA